MRFTSVLVALFGTAIVASAASTGSLLRRQTPQFPTCSDTCLENADFGNCNPSDDTCLCNDAGFVTSVTSCINTACTGSDVAEADAAAQQLCLAVGVTLASSVPASTATSAVPSSTAPASTTASASSSAATTGSAKTNGARSHSVDALAALAAVGVVAFAL